MSTHGRIQYCFFLFFFFFFFGGGEAGGVVGGGDGDGVGADITQGAETIGEGPSA